jgi:hypothetical protein
MKPASARGMSKSRERAAVPDHLLVKGPATGNAGD